MAHHLSRRAGLGKASYLAAAVLIVAGLAMVGCQKSPGNNKHAIPEESTLVFHKESITVAGKNVEVEVARLPKVMPVAIVPLDQTRRDTALHTFESMQSYLLEGKTQADLKAYADCFVDGQAKLATINLKTFETAGKLNEIPTVIGLIKIGRHTVVVSVLRRTQFAGVCMIQKDGKFYIDSGANVSDPVLAQLAAEKYKVLRTAAAQ
jgi:hypothetical protein